MYSHNWQAAEIPSKRAQHKFLRRSLYALLSVSLLTVDIPLATALGQMPAVAETASQAADKNMQRITPGSIRFSGSIRGECQEVRLRPTQASSLNPGKQELGGDYQLVITNESGKVSESKFTPSKALARNFSATHFAVSLPYPTVGLRSIEIRYRNQACPLRLGSQAKTQMQLTTAPAAESKLQWHETAQQLQLNWNMQDFPWLMVTHVSTANHTEPQSHGKRQVLTLDASGGSLSMATDGFPAGGVWEVSLSDGLQTQLWWLNRR